MTDIYSRNESVDGTAKSKFEKMTRGRGLKGATLNTRSTYSEEAAMGHSYHHELCSVRKWGSPPIFGADEVKETVSRVLKEGE